MALPDAGTKLRMVLDYVPCEACLAHPVEEQDLLCTVCARLDREVAVRVGTRTTVLLERPSAPDAAPVLIAPAAAPALPVAASREIVVRFADETIEAPPGAIEVVVEPLAPPPALVPAPAAAVAATPPPALALEEEPVFDVTDIVSFVPARDEFFDYRKPPAAPAPVAAAPPPPPPPAPPEDDFVFRAPAEERVAEAAPAMAEEEVVPREEVPVERAEPEPDAAWSPAPDFLEEERPAPVDEPVEMEVIVEDEPVEMEIVPDDEPAPPAPAAAPEEEPVLEMEILADDEPAPPAPAAGASDLYRLRGFDTAAESALAKAGVTQLALLSGQDVEDLAARSGLSFERLLPWVYAADLVQEVGVPIDAANALVAAGIEGPAGLAEADADEVADRVSAFGGYQVSAREVRRWKRRS